jgi:hypothetical protein
MGRAATCGDQIFIKTQIILTAFRKLAKESNNSNNAYLNALKVAPLEMTPVDLKTVIRFFVQFLILKSNFQLLQNIATKLTRMAF